VRPSAAVFAPVRLALVRAALIIAGLAEVLVEALSLVHGLTRPGLVITWSVAVPVAGAAALLRRRRDHARRGNGRDRQSDDSPGGERAGLRARIRAKWAALGWIERLLGAGLLILVLGELTLALASPPNNYDSQTYHLPKIEHWVAQHGVQFYPTAIQRQITLSPGAEYLLLHLRLLTGGDALYNLLQFSAGVGCVLVASRIAGQLGGTRRAQLLAGFVVGTAPMVALESTSTQTDLVVAAWVACLATLVLDEVRRRTRPADLVLLGTATGLVTLTKATGLLATGPLLLIWGAAQLRRTGAGGRSGGAGRAVIRAAAASVLILGCAAVIAGPYLARVEAEFGNPLGPPDLRDSVSLGRHDPAAILVNALHVGYTALDTPFAPANNAVLDGIDRLSRSLGVDTNDPALTFARTTFPTNNGAALDEDTSSVPVAGGLILLGAGFLLVRPARRVPAEHTVTTRAYAAAFWFNLVVYVATIRWQPWGNRLVLYLVALGAPLAGLWLDAVLRRGRTAGATGRPPAWWRSATAALAACAVLIGGVAGWLAVGYGWPRRLLGSHSVFTQPELDTRFQRRPEWQAGYEWATAAVRASGARRVGVVQSEDAWEYPWWVLLPGRDIVAMQSTLPGVPPARPDQVDALVCLSTEEICASFARPGWRVEMRGQIGYAVPATSGPGATPGG
jgi:hypothetical protein